MNLMLRALAAVCSVAVSLNTGCKADDITHSSVENSTSQYAALGGTVEAEESFVPDKVAEDELAPATNAECTIKFGEDTITVQGDGVQVSGSDAVITEGGVYSFSGESAQGRIIVQSSEDVSLILNGLSLCADGGAVIENSGTGRLVVTLAEGADNNIVCSGADTIGIYSASDIVINGGGGLYIGGSSESAVCGSTVKLCGGVLDIVSRGDGIVGEKYVLSAAGSTEIKCGGDGIKVSDADGMGYVSISGGALDIVGACDGIQVDKAVFISGGEVKLNCGGGNSAVIYRASGARYPVGRHGGYSTDGRSDFDFAKLVSGDGSSVGSKKGIKSGGSIEISGGAVEISSADDSFNARGSVSVSGGTVVLSSGDDGIHADGGIQINGGKLNVNNSYNCFEGMFVEINGGELSLNAYRSGIVAAGGKKLAQGLTDSTQRFVSISDGCIELKTGGSGIDSGGAVMISGGAVTVFSGDKPRFGSVDYRDFFALSGGAFAAFGSDGATKAPSLVSRPCLSVFAEFTKGSIIGVKGADGCVLFSETIPYDSSSFIFSSDEIELGKDYSIYADDVIVITLTVTEGVFGGGPDGRNTGVFDELDADSDSARDEMAA